MNSRISTELPENLLHYLRPGAPALMLTLDQDGYPASAFTWAVALDGQRLRFSVDLGSSTLESLERSGRASLQILGPGELSFLVKGSARQIKPRLDAAAPTAIALWQLDVMVAKDQSWPGVAATPLSYQWPAARREAMLGMEQAVYAEMRDCAA